MLRSAPAVRLRDVASVVSVSRGSLCDSITSGAFRGVCDQTAAGAASGTSFAAALALGSRYCPPPVVRAAAASFDQPNRARIAGAAGGSAAWQARAARQLGDAPSGFRVRARPIGYASPREQAIDAAQAQCPPAVLGRYALQATAPELDAATRRADVDKAGEAALRHQTVPRWVFACAAAGDVDSIRMAAAKNPRCPEPLLRRIAAPRFVGGSATAAGWVLPDRTADAALRAGAVKGSPFGWVASATDIDRAAIARSRAAPEEVLDMLASDDRTAVKANVATNPRTTPRSLDRLAHDDPYLRLLVAGNTSTAPQTLNRLIAGVDSAIARAAAANPACAPATLDRLCVGGDALLAAAAASNASCAAETVASIVQRALDRGDGGSAVAQAALSNPNCPQHLLEQAATQFGGDAALCVARNPACPTSVCVRLAHNNFGHISAAAAAHPNCPRGVRGWLSLSNDKRVREAAVAASFAAA